MDFESVTLKYGEEEYPYATLGQWCLKNVGNLTKILAGYSIVWAAVVWGVSQWAPKLYWVVTHKYAYYPLYLLALLVLGCTIGYMVTTVLRWRRHERDTYANDRQALRMKARLLASMSIHKKLRDASRVKDGQTLTDAQQIRIDSLNRIKTARLQVNTRQSHNQPGVIEKRYQVRIWTPADQDVYKQLISDTADLSTAWTRVLQGQMVIGDRMITPDQREFVWSDSQIVPDRYAKPALTAAEQDTTTYTYSFPLASFIDRSSEVERVTKEAKQWTARAGVTVDRLLSSKDNPAKRLDEVRSPSTLKLIYEIPFSLTGSGKFKAMAALCDETFGASGTRVLVVDGLLNLELPVPKKFRAPIDMASMYREVFGDDRRRSIDS